MKSPKERRISYLGILPIMCNKTPNLLVLSSWTLIIYLQLAKGYFWLLSNFDVVCLITAIYHFNQT